MNSIEWTSKALRQARKFPLTVQSDIADAVETLRYWPHVPQVKDIKDKAGYRLRVGRYRVIFTVHGGVTLVVRIEEVKKRDEHTY